MALPVLMTARLLLRPFEISDVDMLHDIWTDPDVRRYLCDGMIISRDRALGVVRSHFSSVASFGVGYWGVHTLENRRMIGFCGFRFIDSRPQIEIMYGLLPRYWGRGIATEATQAALDYVWRSTSFRCVWGRAGSPNERSIALMQRLKMQFVASTPKLAFYVIARPLPPEGAGCLRENRPERMS
jgi:[ribosomal protein S5]-alanine N-acetyltransferase